MDLHTEDVLVDGYQISGSAIPSPKLTYSTEQRRWILVEEYRYNDPELAVSIWVPEGFHFDLSSVPRVFWNIIAPFELSIAGPLLHDFIYRHGGILPPGAVLPVHIFTRSETDRLFDRVMRAEGVSAWRRKLAYSAVRVFGGRSWGPK